MSAVESPTGTLVVRRPPRRWRDALRSYRIDVDGIPHGLLASGQTLVWHLPLGTHRVQAHLDWTASSPVDVDVSESAPIWLSVKPRNWALWAVGGFGKTGYLAVHELEHGGGYVPSASDGVDLTALDEERSAAWRDAAAWEQARRLPGGEWLEQTHERRTPALVWALVVMVTMAGGLVLGLDFAVTWPRWVLIAGAVAFLSGLVSFGVLAFLAARKSGRGFWSSLGKGLREFFKALGHLLP